MLSSTTVNRERHTPSLQGRLLADGSVVNPLQELLLAEGSRITQGSMLSPEVFCIQWLGDLVGQNPWLPCSN